MVDTLAARIFSLAKAHGVNGRQLADIANVSPQAVQKWKQGGDIAEKNIAAIAKHFGTTPSALRYGVNDEPSARINSDDAIGSLPSAAEIARAYEYLPDDKKYHYAVCMFYDAVFADNMPGKRHAVPLKQPWSDYLDTLRKKMDESNPIPVTNKPHL